MMKKKTGIIIVLRVTQMTFLNAKKDQNINLKMVPAIKDNG